MFIPMHTMADIIRAKRMISDKWNLSGVAKPNTFMLLTLRKTSFYGKSLGLAFSTLGAREAALAHVVDLGFIALPVLSSYSNILAGEFLDENPGSASQSA